MRAVNLLPEGDRPRRPTGQRQGSGYVALGVLGALLLAVVGYVLAGNMVTDRKNEVSLARQQAQAAEARAAELGPFGSFVDAKNTRLASVTSLAKSRLDWERLIREVARVLPADVYLMEATASVKPEQTGSSSSSSGGSSSGSSSSGSSSGTSSSGSSSGGSNGQAKPQGPNLNIMGCARKQTAVATALVRLRQVHLAKEVKLVESTRNPASEASSGSTTGSAGSSGSGTQGGTAPADCGPLWKWQATVDLSAVAPAEEAAAAARVPAALGGGQ